MTSMAAPIACARMYNVCPAAQALWDALFGLISERAGVGLNVIAHAAPAPLAELWASPRIGAVFMCGYPFSRLKKEERPIPLAAPVSHESWAHGGPFYASHIVVPADSPAQCPADLAGARWGWTARDSQSGYHAPRAWLAALGPSSAPAPASVGALINPSGVIAALRDRRIDVGAVDAYAFQLLAHHDADSIADLRILATTPSVPAPMLVAARALPAPQADALRDALRGLHRDRTGAGLLAMLGLKTFAAVDADGYGQLPRAAARAGRLLATKW
ncbi:phosphate/phosphite/phosphonate ABC transporter substrate-binding protein [Brenneria populi subsp. brevivirga]|uniref:phosphate/phosphite/phosphonate ABC transporter substrate-binding protein n=1 Tax=Brenneria populi TaxID=1505588 RepID=UPI002E181A45|nr:phosphate/phosphite/phosphonate ABC transporter substrate-binding protein [Brenneria populi subsp. brevivirga]